MQKLKFLNPCDFTNIISIYIGKNILQNILQIEVRNVRVIKKSPLENYSKRPFIAKMIVIKV
jgi:hypothetical protein